MTDCRACGAPDHPSGCAADVPNLLRSVGDELHEAALRKQQASRRAQRADTMARAEAMRDAYRNAADLLSRKADHLEAEAVGEEFHCNGACEPKDILL